MAPIATADIEQTVRDIPQQVKKLALGQTAPTDSTTTEAPARKYLKPSGILDQFEHIELTPVIGREFPKAKLVDWINAPNADELLTELAYLISSRGVVFFRAQDDLTNDLQKQLIHRLGQLAGKPASSTLHVHPILNTQDEVGEKRESDKEVSTISSKLFKKLYGGTARDTVSPKKQSAFNWHADISFEPVPADYTSLRLTDLPPTGGDTLWASGYELYDRISEPYQKFLETLTVTFAQPFFQQAAERNGVKLYDQPRGSPENVGTDLTAIHPLVRTNGTTGWKSIFPVGDHISHVNGVTQEESDHLLSWFNRLVTNNHDLQVRFRWQNKNDIAIWDNRSNFHAATFDYEGLGDRFGNRIVGIGERPFFDPNSVSRREALAGQNIGAPFQVGPVKKR